MTADAPAQTQTCAHCGRPGRPYTHRGRQFSGLFADQGELLCERCLDHARHADAAALVTEQSDGLEQVRYTGPWDYQLTETPAGSDTERRTSRTP
jgi:hypothetical protein